MSKYIIKNCPCCQYDNYCIASDELFPKKCENLSDCLLKQIVEKCKDAQDKEYRKGRYKFRSPSKATFGREILQSMDIANFTESETRLSEDKENDRVTPEVNNLSERE